MGRVSSSEVGELTLTWLDDGLAVWIEQADPRIWITTGLLDVLPPSSPFHEFDGSLLRIYGVNRTVVYRIGEKVPHMYCYEAEWPD